MIIDKILNRLNKNNTTVTIDPNNIPKHIAIIMDGNGRWAKKRGLGRSIGHKKGSDTLKKVVNDCTEIGIKYLTTYAFSTENWKRPKKEVDYLMGLLKNYLKDALKQVYNNDVKITTIGETTNLTPEIRQEIEKVTLATKDKKGLNLIIALNYGSRAEIVSAVKHIAREVQKGIISIDDICEDYIHQKLYTASIPDPDMLIRTAGEERLSNFLLWQTAYTELYSTKVLWPDFDRNCLLKAIAQYQSRNRKYGGI